MKLNTNFSTQKAKERLRMIKKNYQALEPDIPYRQFRNKLLIELSHIPKTREMLINMIDDIQMKINMDIIRRNR